MCLSGSKNKIRRNKGSLAAECIHTIALKTEQEGIIGNCIVVISIYYYLVNEEHKKKSRNNLRDLYSN